MSIDGIKRIELALWVILLTLFVIGVFSSLSCEDETVRGNDEDGYLARSRRSEDVEFYRETKEEAEKARDHYDEVIYPLYHEDDKP